MISPKGDVLLGRLREGGTADDVHKLIAEFANGYPVVNLKRLFDSERDDAVQAGAWIASELGPLVAPLLDDIARLLRHQLRHVRAYALDAILVAASPADGDVIASAIRLIDDEDEAIRWKAMHFLSRATSQQLRASLRHTTAIRLAALIRWLLDASSNPNHIVAKVDDEVLSHRLFAAAAAARVADKTLEPLRHVANAQDNEISSFAREWLENPKYSS